MAILLLLLGAEAAARTSVDTASAPGDQSVSDEEEGALSLGAVAGVVVGITGVVTLGFLAVCVLQRRLKTASDARRVEEEEKILDALSGLPRRFSYRELRNAAPELGESEPRAARALIRGTLPDGTEIAVRSVASELSTVQLATAGRVRHPNVVGLRGFCARGARALLLVHEFVRNGPLDDWLFAEPGAETPSRPLLDWGRRFRVALGAARGLAFLHDEWAGGVALSDVRPEKVLLDEDFVPKLVVDFRGCSESESVEDANESPSRGKTSRRPPGRDYAPPECGSAEGGRATEKGEVYSYGLVLLELVSGRRNRCPVRTESEAGDGERWFPAVALRRVMDRAYGQEVLNKLIDVRLGGSFDRAQVERVLKVAFWCVQTAPRARPPMREVVLMLEGRLPIGDPPYSRVSMVGTSEEVSEEDR